MAGVIVRPLRNVVLVELITPDPSSESSPIVVPDALREPPLDARVLRVGPDVPAAVAPGGAVRLSRYAGQVVPPHLSGGEDGPTWLLVACDTIIGVLDPPPSPA